MKIKTATKETLAKSSTACFRLLRAIRSHLLWILPVIVVTSYVFREPLLRGVAKCWIKSDTPSLAKAIVVLCGSLQTRPFAAAELYRQGFAPQIIISRAKETPASKLGIKDTESNLIKEVLLSQGVPESAIQFFGHDVTSTQEEALALKEWVRANHIGTPPVLLIPTEYLHTRRTTRIFEILLKDAANPKTLGYPHDSFEIDNWWKNENGLVTFQTEVAKTIYYFWNY